MEIQLQTIVALIAGALICAVIIFFVSRLRETRIQAAIKRAQEDKRKLDKEIAIRKESLDAMMRRSKGESPKSQPSPAKENLIQPPALGSNDLFSAILNNVNDLIVVWDMNMNPCYVSPSVQRVLGYSEKDFDLWRPDGEVLKQIMTPESARRLSRRIAEMMQMIRTNPGQRIDGEALQLEMLREDRSVIWTETQANFLRDAEGLPNGIVSITRDVTEYKESGKAYRALVEHGEDVYFTLDTQGIMNYLSENVERLTGYKARELVGRPIASIIHQQDAALMISRFSAAMDGNNTPISFFRLVGKDGRDVHVRTATVLIYNGGEAVGISGVMSDISEIKRTEKTLRQREELYRGLIENMNDITFQLDQDGRYTYASPVAEYVLGYAMDEIVGSPFTRFIYPEDINAFTVSFQKAIGDQNALSETRVLKKNGIVMYVRISMRMIMEGEEVLGTTGIMSDITQRKEAEIALRKAMEEIKMLSITDALTGCYNRGYLTEHLPYEIKRSRRYHHPMSLILCDIDHFKHVNDTYGHQAGDLVLKEFVKCIRGVIRENMDWLARYGGEEFLLSVGETDLEGSAVLAERLRQLVSEMSVDYKGARIRITASFGVVCHDPFNKSEDMSSEIMINRVDKCLYQAKEEGRNRVITQEMLKLALK